MLPTTPRCSYGRTERSRRRSPSTIIKPSRSTDIAISVSQIYHVMQGRSGTHIILPDAGILCPVSHDMADLLSFP